MGEACSAKEQSGRAQLGGWITLGSKLLKARRTVVSPNHDTLTSSPPLLLAPATSSSPNVG